MNDDRNKVDPATSLMQILTGKIDTQKNMSGGKAIISGRRFSNSFLRSFVERLKKNELLTDGDILDFLLKFDGEIEKGVVDAEFVEKIRTDKIYRQEILKDYEKKGYKKSMVYLNCLGD